MPILLAILAALLAACGATTAGGERLLSYERVWPDGVVESQVIWTDGRIEMRHGENLERFTISAQGIGRLEEALAKPIPTGSPDDSPRRTLTLGDGTIVKAPRPDAGTVTELLDRLLDTHTV